MKQKVIDSIIENKIIVIVRGIKREYLIPTANALYEGGIRLLEVTFDASQKISWEENAENIKMLCDELKGRMHIGAGTVINTEQVEMVSKAGGEFIISPDTFEDVIKKTNELGMVSIPGALTPSEIRCAARAGADFVKLFPIGSLGTAYIKAVCAPLNNIKLLAVGGIDENNISEYMKTGIYGFGIGSGIIKKDVIEAGKFNEITKLAEAYINALKQCR